MHLDLNSADSDVRLDAEVTVIGGGAAGISTARRLLEGGHSVLLLESGGLDYEPATADLNAGENRGEAYYDLAHARLRFFGGTTAIWGGRLAELDLIDFQRRAWVPHSGWPIGLRDIQPYYRQARGLFGVPEVQDLRSDLAAARVTPPPFDPDQLAIGLWTFDRKFNRFVFDACGDLVRHPRCTIVTHATVTSIDLDPDGRFVSGLTARSLAGRTLTVHGRAFVLAAGGLENPRMLLASRAVARHGIGNDHDQVGRYFMEHPHARGGRVIGGDAWRLLNTFGRTHQLDGREVGALVRLAEHAQAEHGVLNSSLTIAARQPADASPFWGMRAYSTIKHQVSPTKHGRAIWMQTKKAATWVQRRTDPLRPWLMHKAGTRDLSLIIRAEQAPNPASRVMLTDQVDALGVPRVALDWRLTDLDTDSVAALANTLDQELRRLGQGRVEVADWLSAPDRRWRSDALISAHPIGGYHHMGTTRMSATPRDGVTDGHGRVHGVENLYLVGSSLFPTSGWANPTLTIVALALRTSDHISARLPASRAA